MSDGTPPPLPEMSPTPLTYEPVAVAPRPRVWTVAAAFAAGLLGALGVPVAALAGWAAVHGGTFGGEGMREMMEAALRSPAFVLGLMAGTVASTLTVALVAARLSPVPGRRRLAWLRPRAGWGATLVLMLGAAAVGMASGTIVGLIETLMHREPEGSLKLLAETIGRLHGAEIVLAYLLIAVGAAVSEELLFRGYIQTRLRQRIGAGWAVVVTAVLFGAMHMDVVQSPAVLGLGLYLGWVRERTGSVRPGIWCHAFNNAAAISGALAGGGTDVSETGTPWTMAGRAAVFAMLAAACVVWARGLIRMRGGRRGPRAAP